MFKKYYEEYNEGSVRICSKRAIQFKGTLKRTKKTWIEIYNYDEQEWKRFKNIDNIPNGAVIKYIYESGNGELVPPFWERVGDKTSGILKDYIILRKYDKFTPAHCVGVNECGLKTYRDDELYRIMVLKKK